MTTADTVESQSVSSGGSESCEKYRLFPSLRLTVCLFAFLGITFNATLFSSIYFGWVCMVNATITDPTAENVEGGTLMWGGVEQRYIFAAYGFGGVLLVLPAGWLTDKFGVRYVMTSSVGLAAIACIVTPVASIASEGVPIMVFLRDHPQITSSFETSSIQVFVEKGGKSRVLVGIGGSTMFVTVYGICTHWMPKAELGAMLGLMLSGLQTGQFLNMLLSGIFCHAIGWPFIFYFWGGVGLTFSLIWAIVYRNDPDGLKICPRKEKEYICQERAFTPNTNRPSIPWTSILTSFPIWTQMIVSFCGFYLIFMVNEYTPTFMEEALHAKDENNGFESALPFIVQIVGRCVAGPLSDGNYKWIKSKTVLVKLFNGVALLGGALMMLGLTFAEEGVPRWIPVLLLCLSLFFLSFGTGGYYKNPLFLAPQYSATIGALSTVSGMLATVILPFVVSAMTPNGSPEEWRKVFYTAVGVGGFGTVFFAIFGTAELQPWAKQPPLNQDHVIPLKTISENNDNAAVCIKSGA